MSVANSTLQDRKQLVNMSVISVGGISSSSLAGL